MTDIYTIIPTSEIGGAEKRIAGIWFELHKRNQLKPNLILSKQMYEKLRSIPEFSGIEAFESFMRFDLAESNYRKTARKIYEFSKSIQTPTLFHYVLAPPLYFNSKIKYLLTYPSTSFKKYNWKGLLTLFHGFFKSDEIDVLDPRIFKKLKSIFAGKVYLTPGSYVHFDHYPSLSFDQRETALTFLGLLSKEKQADRLFQCLIELDRQLKQKGIDNPKFYFLGRPGPDFDLKKFEQEHPALDNVNYEVKYVSDPSAILKKTKVFFSIQRTDNYPSKALLEALACGNLPIVTDVGNTHMIANNDFAEFVPGKFEANDLAEAAFKILSMDRSRFESRASAAQSFIRQNFSIERSLDYFLNLYEAK